MGLAMVGAIAAGMTGSIFSSDAWNNVTFIAGEMKNPKRNIGLSLFLGTLMVTVHLYRGQPDVPERDAPGTYRFGPSAAGGGSGGGCDIRSCRNLCHCGHDHDLDVWL